MGIVQKHVRDIRAGDMVAFPMGALIVVAVIGGRADGNEASIDALVVAVDEGKRSRITPLTLTGLVDVSVPALTPAQEHAEELAELLTRAVTERNQYDNRPEWFDNAADLLNRLNPPEPTLAEALRAILSLKNDPSEPTAWEDIDKLMDRARRAGLITWQDRNGAGMLPEQRAPISEGEAARRAKLAESLTTGLNRILGEKP